MTVTDLANTMYPDRTYDTALPHQWVQRMRDRGFEPVGHFVTLYPQEGQNTLGFYMAPITPQGIEMAARACSMHA